jgi:hypothetical protein
VREALVKRHLEAWRAGIYEAMSLDTVVAELAAGGPIPDVPLVVITAMGIDPASERSACRMPCSRRSMMESGPTTS